MKYLKASALCFIIALIALSQLSCVQQPKYEVGEFKLYILVTIQDEYCEMPDGELVNGLIRYNTIVRSVSEICISKKSDDIRRTVLHELDHAWRNAIGLDPKAIDP